MVTRTSHGLAFGLTGGRILNSGLYHKLISYTWLTAMI